MPVSADLNKLLDKEYENTDLRKLPDAPVSAISGVSENDAKALKQSLRINTIGELAHNRCIRAARAIVELADACK